MGSVPYLHLTLFVSGSSSKSQETRTNLEKFCRQKMGSYFSLSVVNILDDPQLAMENRIIATPTLVKAAPEPVTRLIGDISQWEYLSKELGME